MSGPRPKWRRLKIAVLFSARFSSGLGKKYQQQPVRKLTGRMEDFSPVSSIGLYGTACGGVYL